MFETPYKTRSLLFSLVDFPVIGFESNCPMLQKKYIKARSKNLQKKKKRKSLFIFYSLTMFSNSWWVGFALVCYWEVFFCPTMHNHIYIILIKRIGSWWKCCSTIKALSINALNEKACLLGKSHVFSINQCLVCFTKKKSKKDVYDCDLCLLIFIKKIAWLLSCLFA
jgi:hypothetical protein